MIATLRNAYKTLIPHRQTSRPSPFPVLPLHGYLSVYIIGHETYLHRRGSLAPFKKVIICPGPRPFEYAGDEGPTLILQWMSNYRLHLKFNGPLARLRNARPSPEMRHTVNPCAEKFPGSDWSLLALYGSRGFNLLAVIEPSACLTSAQVDFLPSSLAVGSILRVPIGQV